MTYNNGGNWTFTPPWQPAVQPVPVPPPPALIPCPAPPVHHGSPPALPVHHQHHHQHSPALGLFLLYHVLYGQHAHPRGTQVPASFDLLNDDDIVAWYRSGWRWHDAACNAKARSLIADRRCEARAVERGRRRRVWRWVQETAGGARGASARARFWLAVIAYAVVPSLIAAPLGSVGMYIVLGPTILLACRHLERATQHLHSDDQK
jgi:hypothetical protein